MLVLDGTELCTVVFLPRYVDAMSQEAAYLNIKFAQSIGIHDETVGDLAWDGILCSAKKSSNLNTSAF